MFTALLSFLGGPAIGSLIGAVMGYFNRKLDVDLKKHELEQRRLDREHDAAMRRLDIELAREEAKGKAEVAVIEGSTAIESERMRSLAAAFESDKGPNDWVDRQRRLVRVVLTYLLTFGAMAVNGALLWRLGMVWDALPDAARHELILNGTLWVLTQASAVIAFWFVSRPAEFPKMVR
jgi:hypothetical protein